MNTPLVIGIDGPSASGKGTIAPILAEHFRLNYLNSGALYRLVAFISEKENVKPDDVNGLTKIAKNLSPKFNGKMVMVDGEDIWPIISTQKYGNLASTISPIPELRYALHEFQRSMIKPPGLVAEGRDMCTAVFPDAQYKFYLDAPVKVRAQRRFSDERSKGSQKPYAEILQELSERDHRDENRPTGRLFPAKDAVIINTEAMSPTEVLDQCIWIINGKV